MALDVHTSLANTLFASERAAATKARANEKTAARAADAKTNAAALESATPARFDTLVSEKAPASTGPQKAATSSSSRTRGAMPGRIAGHQDTLIATRDDSTPPQAAASRSVAEEDKPEASAARKPEEAGHEKLETAEAPAVSADVRDDMTPTKADDARMEGQTDQGAGEQAGQHGDGKTQQQESGQENATGSDIASAATSAGVSPEGAALAGVGGVVASAHGASPAEAIPSDPHAVSGVGGISSDGAAPPRLDGDADTIAGVAAPMAADESSPTLAKASAAKAEGGKAEGIKADGAAEPDLLPGMAEHVDANKDQITKEAGDGTAAKASKGAGDVAAPEGKTRNAGNAHASEGPNLRGSVFSQVLNDFAGAHGLNRNNDLLSTLDRPVAALAQANRGADVQRPTPLQMLPIEIGMQAVRGAREFQIRLDPAELGRVDVKLHINDKGEVNASLIVERPETLQLLRRDSTTLTQAFEQAGLKQGENALSFSLKGENPQGQQQQNGRNASVQDSEDAALNAQIGEIAMRRVMIPNSSLDLMV